MVDWYWKDRSLLGRPIPDSVLLRVQITQAVENAEALKERVD